MTRIVRTAHRYKRPPRKRKPVALEVPAIVTMKKQPPPVWEKAAAEIRGHAPVFGRKGAVQPSTPREAERVAPPASKPARIVTARRPGARTIILPPGLLPDTPEEHQQRADTADALWQELVRRVREKP
jgi:hypothetical protein